MKVTRTRPYRQQGQFALFFGLGLTVSFFFPQHLIIVVIAVMMIILSIALMRC